MDLYILQALAADWRDRNFPGYTADQQLLGVVEEVGELAHAHLKGQQGIRHDPEEIFRKKEDAVADIIIFLTGYCTREGIDLGSAVRTTWNRVSARDWQVDPVAGGESG